MVPTNILIVCFWSCLSILVICFPSWSLCSNLLKQRIQTHNGSKKSGISVKTEGYRNCWNQIPNFKQSQFSIRQQMANQTCSNHPVTQYHCATSFDDLTLSLPTMIKYSEPYPWHHLPWYCLVSSWDEARAVSTPASHHEQQLSAAFTANNQHSQPKYQLNQPSLAAEPIPLWTTGAPRTTSASLRLRLFPALPQIGQLFRRVAGRVAGAAEGRRSQDLRRATAVIPRGAEGWAKKIWRKLCENKTGQ